jgi:glycosyltransferase involved in cell wall biosynthesis
MKHSTKTNFLFGQSALQHYLPTRNVVTKKEELPVVLVISTYPPRECGIATYSHDMIHALNEHFDHSFELQVCALQEGTMRFNYPKEVKYTLQSDQEQDYLILANSINSNSRIELVLIQHEFGFFKMDDHHCFHRFLQAINCPKVCVFHTVLPNPSGDLKGNVRHTALFSDAILVMTQHAANVLINEYAVPKEKITIIQHGTHLVPHLDKEQLKKQYHLEGKNVLTTFGLLSSGKGIETTLSALPAIIAQHPEVVFLILGKTHPTVVRHDGEVYRESLEAKIKQLHLENHVQFVNAYLSLPELLEYLQLTDVYLFTSKDPHQTVSGTFSYAMSCGCPIVSTPIPHAKEMLSKDTGIIIDFQDSDQLAKAVNHLLAHPTLRKAFSNNALERITSTSWENAAIAHACLFSQLSKGKIQLHYALPAIELAHFEKMTTHFGMIQFAIINQPDLSSGYTLDDNARAMIEEDRY